VSFVLRQVPENPPLRAGGSMLSELDAQLIRDHAAASDATASLAPRLQALIHERGWLRMLAPAATGGVELALPDVVRLEESLAAADGSVGWVVTLCAGASWFAGFLPPAFARAIVGTTNLCIGGSGAPSGFADAEGEGYRLSGHWQFATGAPLATHFTLNAVLREGGQPLEDSTGAQRVRAFIVPAEHVRVHDSWRSIGLRATASNSFSIDNAWVSAEHAFEINAASATAPGPLYRFPFLSLAYVTIAANISGMAANFLELAGTSIGRRRHPMTGQPLAEIPQISTAMLQAQGDLAAAREHFYRLLDRMWDMVCRDAIIPDADTHALHAASLSMVRAARSAVDEIYPYCGLHAAHEASDIGRVWRDLHTGTQHAMLLPSPPYL
jgi:alkylation response protein AidB-like acyl-CoA dehydrogenase